jgi:ketosteroid isomerase-like protein
METQNYNEKFREAFLSKVTSDVTRYVIEQYFKAINAGSELHTIASLFNKDVNFYIPYHDKQPSQESNVQQKVNNYIQKLRTMMKSIFFDIKSMDVEGEEAAVLTELSARQRKTGDLIDKEISFRFTVHNGEITRFRISKNNVVQPSANPEEQPYAKLSN